MRILQLCLKPPYPKIDGGCVAIASMTETILLAGHEVKMLCMSTHKHPFNTAKIPTDIFQKTRMEAIVINTRIKPFAAFLNLFSDTSYNVERFYSEKFERRLIQILQESEFDIIHLESVFCTPYIDVIRRYSNAKVVVRAHNIEFRIWEQLASGEKNPIKKWYLNLLALRLKQYELNVLNEVDGIISITMDDAIELKTLGVRMVIDTIPIGMQLTDIEVKPVKTEPLHLYHLGAMDWKPNVEGVQWFIDTIWPELSQEFPDIKCSLAGRGMPPTLLSRSADNLSIEGEVSSVSEFISNKNVAIIPLLSGSGLRVKIVEALAFGKVVITTSLGATGIPFEDGKNMLIANTPEEFIAQVRKLENSPYLIESIGKEARELAINEFDLTTLSSKLTYFYANL